MIEKRKIEVVENYFYNDIEVKGLAVEFTTQVLQKYPFLEIELKWNCPFFTFQDKILFYLTKKDKFEKEIYKKSQLFIGFHKGYNLFQSKLFLDSKLVNVKYINFTKSYKKINSIIDIVGNSIDVN
jgi:hypothetical protein